MKRPITILCVLLLLVVVIGLERFRGNSRSETKLAARTDLDAPASRNDRKARNPTHSDKVASRPVESESNSSLKVSADSQVIDLTSQQSPSSAANAASGRKISEIHYIRSRGILGNAEPEMESIARLREAVRQTASSFEGFVMIIDLDGLTTSQSRFISYASPRFDLTESVQAAYHGLEEKEAEVSQEEGIEREFAASDRPSEESGRHGEK